MNIRVYLLDVSYEIVGREPHIILWGVDESGKRVLLRDKTFRPYFYVLPEDEGLINYVVVNIKRLTRPRSPIINVEVLDKKYFGRPVKAIKVTTVIPEAVREYRELAKKIKGVKEVLEADIRFAMRYLIDKGITPSSWIEVPVEEVKKSPIYRVDVEYIVKGEPKIVLEHIPPKLRIVAFDIEVYNYKGSPRPERDPIIIIAVKTDKGDVKQFLAKDKSDAEIIKEFINFIQSYDPDIIVGYNSNGFDWPYMLNRSKIHGIVLDVGRVKGVEPRTSTYGHISIPGRLNVDLYDFAEEITEVKIKSLDVVAEYLGVMKRSERVLIPWYEIYKYWDDKSKRNLLLKYSLDDVNSTYGIAEKILPFAIQLSSLTGLPLDQVGSASVGFRLEWYLMRAAYNFNELIPNRVERPYEPYKGAIVLEPLKGIHNNIAVLDFSSMYPNIMIKYNIGPDTYIENEEECEIYGGCYETPEVRYLFREKPPGFYKLVLETLLKLRKAVRDEMKRLDPKSPEYKVLDERQKALKILANASYGYMGWPGARWYFKQGAEAVTAWGRRTITKAINIAKSLGLRVIYGDTDSLFVEYKKELIDKFINFVYKELELEIKVDKLYKRVFFTEAKKRYMGLTTDGVIDIVGFEAVRGDWAEIAKEVQEKIAYIILTKGSVNEAIEYVRNVIRDLQNRKIPMEKIIIWKTITKPLDAYEVDAPHVAAAKRLLEAGWKVDVGDKIGYVVLRGSGKISSRAYPYSLVSIEDIDVNYYIDHQIIPAALRVLEYFGVTEKQLKVASKGVKSLFDFAKK